MDGALLDLSPNHQCLRAPVEWEQVVAELVSLRRENAELRRENTEQRQQAGYWKSRHADAFQRLAKSEAEAEQLRGENRKLQDRLFGRKTEKKGGDRSNELLPDGQDKKPGRKPRGQRKGRLGPPRRDHSHLPVIEEFRDVPEVQRTCPDCGLPHTLCGSEDSEQIEIDVKAYRRRIRRRRYRRSCHCPAAGVPQTVTAPPAPKLIPKGLLGVSVWGDYGSGALWSGRLTAMLFSWFGTLRKQGLNARKWLAWYLESCAAAGGKARADVTGFLPWNLTEEKRRGLALQPRDTS